MRPIIRTVIAAAILPATIFLAGCSGTLGEKPVATATMSADQYYQTALDASVAAMNESGITEVVQVDGAPHHTTFFDGGIEGSYKQLKVDDVKGAVTPSATKGQFFLDALVAAKATPKKDGKQIIASATYEGEKIDWTLTVDDKGVITAAEGKGASHSYVIAIVYEVTAGGKALLEASNASSK